jgi:hypothetical protein
LEPTIETTNTIVAINGIAAAISSYLLHGCICFKKKPQFWNRLSPNTISPDGRLSVTGGECPNIYANILHCFPVSKTALADFF